MPLIVPLDVHRLDFLYPQESLCQMQNRKAFLTAVQQPAASLDTVECALLFSQALNPGLDVQHYSDILASISKDAKNSNIESAEDLLSFVHGKHNFHGNPNDYYQIENSLLDSVLESKTGIPISLALIYLSVGHSTNLSVYGISFPGHFLIGVGMPSNISLESATLHEPDAIPADASRDSMIDPFRAQIVTRTQCFDLLDQLYQGQVKHDDRYFAPAGKDTILLRLIENVKTIYLKQGSADRALTCLDYQPVSYTHLTLPTKA